MQNEANIGLEIAEQTQGEAPATVTDTPFEALFREHQSSVYRWILRIVRDPAVAEDLTIETFWRIYRSFAQFDPTRSFEPWARRIATRVALDWLRVRPRECAATDELLAVVPDGRTSEPGVSAEIRAAVRRAFAKLPPKLRVTATLVVLEECTHKEAADALAISAAAVKVRVFRALRLLRKELREQGMEP